VHHYVYYSYEPWKRGYIGVRSCKCKPEEDTTYFGSYKDKSFNPTEKIILITFKTREEALDAEVALHAFFEVNINAHFANRSKQLTRKFSTAGCEGPWKNKKQSPEHVRKHAEALKGRSLSEETKRKIGLKSKGNKHRAGHSLTEEQKDHLREVNTGRKHSEQTIEKIRQAKTGKKHSEEAKIKMSKNRKGAKHAEESKEKISAAIKQKFSGKENRYSVKRVLSEETKKKISEKLKLSHQRKKENNGT